jgi:flagellar motor switch protein FliM
MADQILTQEEIDALLSAMDRGEVDLEEEVDVEAEIVPYNLTSQNIMLGDQFYALEEVYDKFATLLGSSLSTLMGRSMEVEFVSTELVKYQQCMSAFSSPTNFTIFTMEPLIGSALLAIEPKLVYSVIDCMFGGEGKPTERTKEFTLIEQRMMRRFAAEVLSNLEKAWKNIVPIKFTLKKNETKPEFVHLTSPNDLVLVIVFVIRGAAFSGHLHLGIPYLMLEPVKDQLSSKYLRDKDMGHAWKGQLQMLLQDTPVTLIAELGTTTQSVRDLLEIQVGDVLQLNIGPEDLITLSVEHVPKFYGFPGTIKGNRAVEITALLQKNGGENA